MGSHCSIVSRIGTCEKEVQYRLRYPQVQYWSKKMIAANMKLMLILLFVLYILLPDEIYALPEYSSRTKVKVAANTDANYSGYVDNNYCGQ